MIVCGEWILVLRESVNYSQRRSLRFSNWASPALSVMKKGEVATMLELLVCIAGHFDASLDYIFDLAAIHRVSCTSQTEERISCWQGTLRVNVIQPRISLECQTEVDLVQMLRVLSGSL